MKSEPRIFENHLTGYPAQCILDFGVGAGASTKELMRAVDSFERVWGIDCSNPEQEISQELIESSSFDYIQHDDVKLPFDDHEFDIVQISNTLHHINKDEIGQRITELFRVLKEGGLFILIEGIRDNMDAASQTQNYLHIVRAFLDRENGIQHYPQFWQRDIQSILDKWDTEIVKEYCINQRREDYREKRMLDNISVFIDGLKTKYRGTKSDLKALGVFESIQKRIYRTGYSGTPVFVSIRRKKSAPGRMAG